MYIVYYVYMCIYYMYILYCVQLYDNNFFVSNFVRVLFLNVKTSVSIEKFK